LRDVRTSEMKTAVKQCCLWSAETKPRSYTGSFVLFQFYFTMCGGL